VEREIKSKHIRERKKSLASLATRKRLEAPLKPRKECV